MTKKFGTNKDGASPLSQQRRLLSAVIAAAGLGAISPGLALADA